jgi:signal transduction histidine kinase/ActR/RegA family two-component response regulator
MNNDKNISLVILEDEEAHAEALLRSLSKDEFDITIAASLEEFNRVISRITPDLVIADINLPDGSALSLLNSNAVSQLWPVLVMTSYGNEDMAVTAIKAGALDYIVKSSDAFKNIKHVINRNLRDWSNIQESRENEKKFRILFETMAQGVVYQDYNGNIIAANSAAEKILGLNSEQLKNRTSFDTTWSSIHEDCSPFPGETHPSVIALNTGKPVEDVIMGIYNPELNVIKWVLVSAIPQFRDNEKEPYQVFSTFTDITELKNAEAELVKSKEKAEESDRLKSAFLANMSHEIRTPMNGIMGFADLLKTPELSGESQKNYIEIIEASGNRMLEIINHLIDISRIEAGQIEIKLEPVYIPDLLKDLMKFFSPEANDRNILLRSDIRLEPDEYFIETDKTKLAQVITNLIKNALKFTDRNGYIKIGCNLHGHSSICFYVKDTGSGIRKELHEKIFDRFIQGDISHKHEGVGLGLAISKAYVEMLGGKIGLDSIPGKGSVFYFILPLVVQVKSS